jgi:hypothetical protein
MILSGYCLTVFMIAGKAGIDAKLILWSGVDQRSTPSQGRGRYTSSI